MAATSMTTHAVAYNPSTISRLQGEAWEAWNASYHADDREVYRIVGRDLYNQDVQERVNVLLARSDAQNALIDAMLAQK